MLYEYARKGREQAYEFVANTLAEYPQDEWSRSVLAKMRKETVDEEIAEDRMNDDGPIPRTDAELE